MFYIRMNYGFNEPIKENTVNEYTYDGKPLWLGLFVSDDHRVNGRNKTAYEIMKDNCFNYYSFNIETYCKGDVNKGFGNNALEEANMIFVTFDSKKNNKIAGPRAFMCVKKNHLSWSKTPVNGFYYIELICSAKTKRLPKKYSPPGKALLNALKQVVVEKSGKGIGLRAINTVISYYARQDWKLHAHGKLCEKEEEKVQHDHLLRSVELVKWLHGNRLKKGNEVDHGKKYGRFIDQLPKGTASDINAQWEEFKNDCAPEKGVEPEEDCADDFILYNSMSKAADGLPMIWCNPDSKKTDGGGRKKRRRKKKRTKKRKKGTKKKTKKYRTRKQLNGIWKRNTRKAKCSRLKKGSWAKKKKHCKKNKKCFWSGQRDICYSKKMY
jgi:hypothetical protein